MTNDTPWPRRMKCPDPSKAREILELGVESRLGVRLSDHGRWGRACKLCKLATKTREERQQRPALISFRPPTSLGLS